MNYLSISTVIFFVMYTSGLDEDQLVFRPSTKLLSKCIEDQLLKSEKLEVATVIADQAAKKFSRKTVTRKALHQGVRNLFYILRHIKKPLVNPERLSRILATTVKKALEDCANDISPVTTAPVDEPSEIADVPGTVDPDERFVFTRDESTLSRCVETNLLNTDRNYEEEGVAKVLADRAAKKFFKMAPTRKALLQGVRNMFYTLKHGKSVVKNLPILSKRSTKTALKRALIHCADGNKPTEALLEDELSEVNDIAVTDRVNDRFVFSTDKAQLSKCIEDYLVRADRHYEEDGSAKVIADLVARRFSGRFKTRSTINWSLALLFYDLRNNRLSHALSSDQVSSRLQDLIESVLENCASDSGNTELPGMDLDDKRFVFRPSKTSLSRCIEVSLSGVFENDGIAKVVADRAAKKFSGKIKTRKTVHQGVHDLFYDLRHNKKYRRLSDGKLPKRLLKALRKALKDCAGDVYEEPGPVVVNIPESVDWSDRVNQLVNEYDAYRTIEYDYQQPRVFHNHDLNDSIFNLHCVVRDRPNFSNSLMLHTNTRTSACEYDSRTNIPFSNGTFDSSTAYYY